MSEEHTITLSNGNRQFSALSNIPESGIFAAPRRWNRVVFLLHGFPDNNSSYRDIWPVLLEGLPQGVLLISPSMRGYERSSQGSQNDYKIADLASDINAWIKQVVGESKTTPVHLVGHDWGAIAVYRAAYLYPEAITSVVTLAIPYLSDLHGHEILWYAPEQLYLSSYMLTMQFRSFYHGKLSAKSSPDTYLDRLWSYWSPTWKFPRAAIENVRETINGLSGTLDAVTAYYRCLVGLSVAIENFKAQIDFDRVPTLILAGSEDGCMSRRLFDYQKVKLADRRNVKVQVLEGIGHFLHREDPTKVGELIVDWFTRHATKSGERAHI